MRLSSVVNNARTATNSPAAATEDAQHWPAPAVLGLIVLSRRVDPPGLADRSFVSPITGSDS
jgi:hypothetical protein